MEEVNLEVGKFVLRKPLAGERNKAVMAAETADGLKMTVFLVELLPYSIKEHPFGISISNPIKVKAELDKLEIEDYDKILKALQTMMEPKVNDIAKKSEEPSQPSSSQVKDGSKTSSLNTSLPKSSE